MEANKRRKPARYAPEHEAALESHKQSKQARYIASIAYLVVLMFLVGGTLISEHNKQQANSGQEQLSIVK